MGSITPYDTANGRRYRVRYRKPDHTQTDKRGFTTKREAERFLASVTIAKATGDYIDPSLSRVTVGALAATWLASKRPPVLKPSSYLPLKTAWHVHVEPRWGQRELRSILPSEVQAWVTELATTRSPSVVIRALGVLAGVLDMAIDDRRISRNPARGLRNLPRRSGRKRRVYLTHKQLLILARVSAHPTLVMVLGYCGLRWGEATALRVRHVNRVRRRFNVEENAVLVRWQIHVGTPKTHERRSVPYMAALTPLVDAVCEDKEPDDLLFGNGKTHMKRENDDKSWFAVAVRRAQKIDPTIPRLTPHDLRHTAASLAISAGANVKAVQKMLGHASAAMTLDTYSDLFEDDLDAVAAQMETAAATGPHSVLDVSALLDAEQRFGRF
ncbi:tyrosine-type recombinase/integrase [Microbacterium sp. A93]|uniref:tyrosine-type recombinase/integrase n=1 Tax=Microbacterium sp. A93 TaxID=3450716 RepID=UPI003F42AA60